MKVLDPCCGSRMMYFDKQDQRCLFGDLRTESHYLKDRGNLRHLEIHPDVRLDFTALPFADDSFNLVVFDPPHLVRAGKKSWLAKKYGQLTQDWRDDHTQIPWRGKPAADCPDSPRYKAIGNSMAVPVMRWIGERICRNKQTNDRAVKTAQD